MESSASLKATTEVVRHQRKITFGQAKDLAREGMRFARNLPFGFGNLRLAAKINKMIGWGAVDYTRAEDVRAAYKALASKGVTGPRADELINLALTISSEAAGKNRAWKGLLRLKELIVYGDVDIGEKVGAKGAEARLRASMMDPIYFANVPGFEVIVRDYNIARKMAELDGRVNKETGVAALTQSGGSVVPGFLQSSPEAMAAARKYLLPLDMFFNSMVTADGQDHQTQKRVFMPFYLRGAVLDTAPFVEATLQTLMDDVSLKAARRGGAFDFKMDFAFHFPIRIISHVLGIPPEDAPHVQEWAEQSVRTLDAGIGISPTRLTAGNLAAAALRDYLHKMVDRAAAGEEIGGAIGELGRALGRGELPIDKEVLVANLAVQIFAGFETTTGLFTMGIHELLQRPDQWAHLNGKLVQGDELQVDGETVKDHDLRWYAWADGEERDLGAGGTERRASLKAKLDKSPELRDRKERLQEQEKSLEAAVDEMLRCTAPGSVIPIALNDDYPIVLPEESTINGRTYAAGETVTLKKGTMAHLAVDDANRRCPFLRGGQFDPKASGEFDITREDNKKHLSFGRAHACIGARLATENMKRALEAVLRRFPDLQLNGQPVPQDFDMFNGMRTLPVKSPHLAYS